MFATLSRRRERRARAAALYAGLLAQTRRAGFYRDLGVPDTFDGRFDLLVLHAFLLFRRLGQTGEAGKGLAQEVFDAMFADMDDVLREMGVGDMSIARKIRGMSEAFYGRVKAYDEALAQGGEAMEAALIRNVYAGADAGESPRSLARYVRASDAALAAASLDALALGEVPFPRERGAA